MSRRVSFQQKIRCPGRQRLFFEPMVEASGEHQHRCGRRQIPDQTDGFDAVHDRHLYVQQNCIRRRLLPERGEQRRGGRKISRAIHPWFGVERTPQLFRVPGIVIHHPDAKSGSSIAAFRCRELRLLNCDSGFHLLDSLPACHRHHPSRRRINRAVIISTT